MAYRPLTFTSATPHSLFLLANEIALNFFKKNLLKTFLRFLSRQKKEYVKKLFLFWLVDKKFLLLFYRTTTLQFNPCF
jgi:hypothetical protein